MSLIMNFFHSHPVATAVGGVTTAIVLVAIGSIIGVCVNNSRKSAKSQGKTPQSDSENIPVDIRDRQIKWFRSQKLEIRKNTSFNEYLNLCIAIQDKRNLLNSLKAEYDKLHIEAEKLAVVLEQLYTKFMDPDIAGDNKEALRKWQQVSNRLKSIQETLKNICEKINQFEDEINKLEKERDALYIKYKEHLKDFQNN